MSDLLAGQSYPDLDPCIDIRPFLINGWGQKGNAACAIRAEGNTMQVIARLTIGTDRIITSGMPNLHSSSGGKLIPASIPLGGGDFLASTVIWASDGNLAMHWTWSPDSSMNEVIAAGTVPR